MLAGRQHPGWLQRTRRRPLRCAPMSAAPRGSTHARGTCPGTCAVGSLCTWPPAFQRPSSLRILRGPPLQDSFGNSSLFHKALKEAFESFCNKQARAVWSAGLAQPQRRTRGSRLCELRIRDWHLAHHCGLVKLMGAPVRLPPPGCPSFFRSPMPAWRSSWPPSATTCSRRRAPLPCSALRMPGG